MKNRFFICLMVLILTGVSVKAEEKKVSVKLSGFVAAESYFDTRKTVNSREGAILLYPANELLDSEGNDLNDRSEFFMTTVQSRLRATVSGFEAFGAQGSAVIEGDFVGTSNDKTGLFRLRHAFIKLDWEKDQLIAGKFWHPMFVPSAYPNVLHWGAGLPFGLLNRAPQLRYTRKLNTNTTLSFAALSEMDFKSTGPDGISEKYAQQSSIPEFTAQVKTNLSKGVEAGFTAGYKTIMPLTVNSNGVKTDEKLGSYYFNTWLGMTGKKLKWNLQGIYGQNMYNFVMIGGYGVKNVKANGDYEYTNISTMSLTSDLYTTTGNVRYGFNLGYSKNLGAADDLAKGSNDKFIGLYSRGSNIDYLYQISPRIEFLSGKMKFGGEIIYTGAAYGTTQIDGTVVNTDLVSSTRVLLHVKYTF
ncbi:hypothetical protein [Ancylomarina euxinus]|nr:hypothetical protein [Ancylomarina euxinus]MCZ4695059.1 hypothetical protein [Ancylomarina euxinus]MUP15005.1 hypothetical protein [Ancylomarina euxinus]